LRWTVRDTSIAHLVGAGVVQLSRYGTTWLIGETLYGKDSVAIRSDSLYRLTLDRATSCDGTVRQRARVLADAHGVRILEDIRNPSGQFLSSAARELAQNIRDLAIPVATQTFGEISDRDGNGKLLVVVTAGVNALTPRGSTGISLGYVTAMDAFPQRQTDRLSGCRAGNGGEVFYLLAPDVNGEFSDPRSLETIRRNAIGTTVHEIQHLINVNQRLHVAQGDPFEVVWLNEGLSHIAEDELYRRRTGLPSQGRPLTFAAALAAGPPDTLIHPLWQNLRPNLSRLVVYVQDPAANGIWDMDADLPTRGAVWSFLRYLADRFQWNATTWKSIVNSRSSGLENLQAAVGSEHSLDLLAHDWIVMNALDSWRWPATRSEWESQSWSASALMAGAFRRTPSQVSLSIGSQWQGPLRSGGGQWLRLVSPTNGIGSVRIASGPDQRRICVDTLQMEAGRILSFVHESAQPWNHCLKSNVPVLLVVTPRAVVSNAQELVTISWAANGSDAASAGARGTAQPELDESAAREARWSAQDADILRPLLRSQARISLSARQLTANVVPAWRITLIAEPAP